MILDIHPPVRGLILDLDGVLWKDTQAIGDLSAIFNHIRELGIQVTLATNNATKSVPQYLEKMAGYGVTLEPWQVIHSGIAVAEYLAKRFPQGGPVYTFGEQGLIDTLAERGFTYDEENPIAVVAGIKRNMTFQDLCKATLLIRKGLPFIGTNPDVTFPTPEGLIPGAGAILALLKTASSVEPVVVGKPATTMFELAMERMGLTRDEVMGVGDRLETDTLGAQKAGIRTALVLSGVTSAEDARAWQPAPTIIAPDLATLVGLKD